MPTTNHDKDVKRAKNIAAIVYLFLLTFLVGGTYLHQHQDKQSLVENNELTEAQK